MSDVQGETTVPVTAPALGISVQSQVSPTKQFVFQTHVPAETSAEDLDRLLDKLAIASDRAEAYYQIEVYEAELKRAQDVLTDLKYRLDNVDENARLAYEAAGNKRAAFRLSSAEEKQKVQAQDQVRVATRNVEECQKRLDETRKKAGTRHGSPTDRDAGVPDRQVP